MTLSSFLPGALILFLTTFIRYQYLKRENLYLGIVDVVTPPANKLAPGYNVEVIAFAGQVIGLSSLILSVLIDLLKPRIGYSFALQILDLISIFLPVISVILGVLVMRWFQK